MDKNIKAILGWLVGLYLQVSLIIYDSLEKIKKLHISDIKKNMVQLICFIVTMIFNFCYQYAYVNMEAYKAFAVLSFFCTFVIFMLMISLKINVADGNFENNKKTYSVLSLYWTFLLSALFIMITSDMSIVFPFIIYFVIKFALKKIKKIINKEFTDYFIVANEHYIRTGYQY